MNKKFLSAILFGALMVTSTGTFVSCKDYDEDINNLQEQINKLATKDEMSSQIATLQSALSAAQSEAAAAKTTAAQALEKANGIAATATEAEKAAAEAQKAAAQAALDAAAAKEEAIAAAKEEVAKAQEALEKAIATNFEAVKEQLAKQIAELTKKVEEMTGYTTQMLTGLQIQGGSALDLNYATVKIAYPKDLVKGAAIQTPSSYEFGKGMPGAFTLTNGDVNTTKSTFVVKADPVNAVLSAENLSLINSKNVDVDDYVTYSVGKYNGSPLTQWQSRSAIGGTGLYSVGVQLKKNMTSEDFETFDKQVLTYDGYHDINVENCGGDHWYILHALAVNDAAKGRSVTTDYAVTMHVQKEGKARRINVYSMLYSSARHLNNYFDDYIGQYEWAGDNTIYDEWAYPVVNGEAFDLEVGSEGGRVMASYVVVDYDNANLSVTDKAALQGVTVSGVNNVTTNNYHSLMVSGTYASGIPVPLKLVTVDYTGNIEVNVFWVKAGEPALMTAAFSVTPSKHVDRPYAWVAESTMEEFKVPAGTTKYTLELTVGETNHQSAMRWKLQGLLADANSEGVLRLYKSNKQTLTTTVADIAYAKFVGVLDLQVMREDKAYEGSVKFYNSTGTYLGSNTITVKKVLPTAIPAGLTAKTNAIHADGTLPVYPTPSNDGATGYYDLKNAFNFSDALFNDANLTFNEVNGFWYSNETKAKYNNGGIRTITGILKNIIGSINTYPTVVKYNYGDIKYHPEGHGVSDPGNYVVDWATKFAVKFGCVPAASTYAWYATPTVYYQEETLIEAYNATEKKYYNFMTVKNPYGKTIDAFDSTDADWTTWTEALNTGANTEVYLLTNGNRKNEFFTAKYEVSNGKTALKLTPNPSVTTVLEADVETTVVLVIYDKFGHKHEVKALTFTMKKDRK